MLLEIIIVGLLSVQVRSDFLTNYCGAPVMVDAGPLDGYTLVQLHLLHRHGDRVPEVTFPEMGEAAFQCTANVMRGTGTEGIDRRYNVTKWGPNAMPGSCVLGQLTGRGVRQLKEQGEAMRYIYVDNYELLPATPLSETIRTRVSPIQRTSDSAMSLLHGLYPDNKGPGSVRLKLLRREDRYDGLVSPSNCDLLPATVRNLSATDPTLVAFISDVLEPLVTEVAEYLNVTHEEANVVWRSALGSWGPYFCHGHPIPIPYDMLLEIVEVYHNYTKIILNSPTLLEFENGQLFTEMLSVFNQTMSGDAYPALVHYSGHDTTVLATLAGLQAYPETQWPPYASHLRFEVWSSVTNITDARVRAIYNNDVLTLPCSDGESTRHCPLPQFLNLLRSRVKANFMAQCLLPPYPELIRN